MRPPYKISWLLTCISLLVLIFWSLQTNYTSNLFENLLAYFTGKSYHMLAFVLTVLPIYTFGVSVIITYYKFQSEKTVEEASKDSVENTKFEESNKISSYEEKALIRLSELIEAKFYKQSDLKAEELASKLIVHRHHLNDIMKLAGYKNFTDMLNFLRIQESCNLLDTDDLVTIKMVSYEVGYNTVKHFISQFQKYKGCTPSIYKNKR